MIRRLAYLFVFGMALILLAGVPARMIAGDLAFVFCGTAVMLCLVPGLISLALVGRLFSQDPSQAALGSLGASGIRMVLVLSVALFMYMQVPPFQGRASFLIWVAVIYMVFLATEVAILLQDAQSRGEAR